MFISFLWLDQWSSTTAIVFTCTAKINLDKFKCESGKKASWNLANILFP
jgi:hypothetical protein